MLITVHRPNSSPVRIYINPPAKPGKENIDFGRDTFSVTRGDERLTLWYDTLLLQTPVQYTVWHGLSTEVEIQDIAGIRANILALRAWKQNKEAIFWFHNVGVRLDKENNKVILYKPQNYCTSIDKRIIL